MVSSELFLDLPEHVSIPRYVSFICTNSRIRTTFWFLSGNDIHFYGGGTIDGNGQVWYDALAGSQVCVLILNIEPL